ncbi:MAG: efflux RND transporter periplasmic adaptor subunit [Sulfuricellaceae bacterium]|nr:efflux RND transporter periplasmic adaptor subunit [Sulfuricellaceae bacterium]
MKKRMIVMLVAAGIVFGGIFAFQAFKAHMIKKFMAAQARPPQTVSTVLAVRQEWLPTIKAVGSLRAVRGADLAPEIAGLVVATPFKSGDTVKAGTLLVQLRADSERARLDSLKAAAELAEITFKRDRDMLKAQAISQAAFDADAANLKSIQAQVAEQQALVAKKSIRAPFAGRIGIRQVDQGQYVNAGDKIATLQELDPIFVDFYIPQQELSRIKAGETLTAATDTFPGEKFRGEITAINPKVDVDTRNVQVRAALKNPRHKLLPGMFASVSILSGQPQSFVTLPQSAISYSPYGDTVFLVEAKGRGADGKPALAARQQFVTLGRSRGDQVAILKGVKPGDTVVDSGQLKLKNGTPVIVNNSIRPSDDAAPKPLDQ